MASSANSCALDCRDIHLYLNLSILKSSIKFRKVDSCKSFKWTKETEACQMGGLVSDSVSGVGDSESVFIEVSGMRTVQCIIPNGD